MPEKVTWKKPSAEEHAAIMARIEGGRKKRAGSSAAKTKAKKPPKPQSLRTGTLHTLVRKLSLQRRAERLATEEEIRRDSEEGKKKPRKSRKAALRRDAGVQTDSMPCQCSCSQQSKVGRMEIL